MRKIILALVATAAGLSAVPASAKPFAPHFGVGQQIRREIGQLDNQIQRAAQRRTISLREATSLRRDARNLQRLCNRYSRNGLNRAETVSLQAGVNRLHQQLRLERTDRDGRRG